MRTTSNRWCERERAEPRGPRSGVAFGDALFVRGSVEELGELVGLARGDDQHPAVVVTGVVDEFRALVDRGIYIEHIAGDRCVDIPDCLDGLDHAEARAAFDLAADLGEFDEDDVSELPLGEISHADRDLVRVAAHPFVFRGVSQLLRNRVVGQLASSVV
jgi:hypothetical protein